MVQQTYVKPIIGGIIALVVIVGVVYFMSTSGMLSGVSNAGTTTTPFTPARIQVVDYNLQHTEGEFFTIHYDLTGQLMNRGGMNSGPIVLGLNAD
jgi:hypothetical protein